MPTSKTPKTVKKSSSKSQKPIKNPVPAAQATEEKVKGVFDTLKKKFEPGKVDEFQKKWLALPENRKKYQKISDAPQVAAEEIIAITNDLIDYLQGEQTGKSGLLKKLKSTVGSFFKNPAKFVQEKAEAGKEMAIDMKHKTQEKAEKMASSVQKTAQKKLVSTLTPAPSKKTSSKTLPSKTKPKDKKTTAPPKK